MFVLRWCEIEKVIRVKIERQPDKMMTVKVIKPVL
jgi:hypothetical protein